MVTYYWYRFADQPALLNADLTDAERESLQKRVEMLHKNWTKDREYLPPADGRQARRPRPGGARDAAEGPGNRLRADRHPTRGKRIKSSMAVVSPRLIETRSPSSFPAVGVSQFPVGSVQESLYVNREGGAKGFLPWRT